MRTTLFALACIAAAACAAPAAANEMNQAQPTLAAAAAPEPPQVDWAEEPCPRRTFMRGHHRVSAEPRYCRMPVSLVQSCAYEIDIHAASRRNAMGKRGRRNGISRCLAPNLDVA